MRIDFKSIQKATREFLRDNAKTAGDLFVVAIIYAVCKRFSVPVCTGSNVYDPGSTYLKKSSKTVLTPVNVLPTNTTETAVLAMYKSALSMTFDSDKISTAKQIRDLVSVPNVSNETRSFAITLLGELTKDMNFDSDKKVVLGIISTIQKGDI